MASWLLHTVLALQIMWELDVAEAPGVGAMFEGHQEPLSQVMTMRSFLAYAQVRPDYATRWVMVH